MTQQKTTEDRQQKTTTVAMAPGPRRGVTSPARAGGPARGGRPGAQYAYAQFAVAADSQTSLRMAESRHDSTAARGTSVCRTFTIAHVNAALLRKELDVVSVCLRTYHLWFSHHTLRPVPSSSRTSPLRKGDPVPRTSQLAVRVDQGAQLLLRQMPAVVVAAVVLFRLHRRAAWGFGYSVQ